MADTRKSEPKSSAAEAPGNPPQPPQGAKTGKMDASAAASEAAAKSLAPLPQGDGGETQQRGGSGTLTTNHGTPVSDNQNSLKAGSRGPTLLADFVLREKIFHFDHERIPERIVHARGSGAHGTFTVTEAIPELTRAKLFAKKGNSCDVFTRFSTVAGGSGSVDTPRDVRGFAVKFYTEEGNWDLVGNNIPVFFIQDAMKFPDLVHSVKMEADRGYPQAASAHDTFWDFISLMPESMHMVMWAMSDRSIPRSLRMMEGFGVHTFVLENEAGKTSFVKFHWKPRLGIQSTLWNEAVKIAGADPDFHRRDLWEAIDAGDFPEWDLGVQVFDQDWAAQQPYDVLDATKLIPEEEIPVRIIGTMQLNRNPDNFFAETEQVAFLPTNILPGMDFSEDPLLQGRLFSYLDTQKSRLGTTNFHQIPINAPRCPFANMQRDGMMQTMVHKGRANYEPNGLAEAGEDPGPRAVDQGFRSVERFEFGNEPEGKLRVRAETFADHFSQARLFYRSQTEVEQGHMADAMIFELSKVELPHVRVRLLGQLRNVDEALAAKVAEGLAMDLPAAIAPAKAPVEMKASDKLSILKQAEPTLKGRCYAILCAEDSDMASVEATKGRLEAGGGTVKVVALKRGKLDGQLAGSPSVLFDGIVTILMPETAKAIAKYKPAVDFVSDAYAHCKGIAHCKGSQVLLDRAGVEPGPGVGPVEDAATLLATRYHDREATVWTF